MCKKLCRKTDDDTNEKKGNDEDCWKWKDKIDFKSRKQKRRCEIPFMDSLNIWIYILDRPKAKSNYL